MGPPVLARCISVSTSEFASDFWGRKPLLSRAAELPRDYSDLLTLDAVDEIVATRGLRTPFARMAMDGSVLPTVRFTGPGGAGAEIADLVSGDKVLAEMLNGSTLVLQGMHRFWPPLVDFATALAGELRHSTQVNVYITPPQSQGFSAHYDVHDVFVLQVAGRKRWKIHEPVFEAPLRNQEWSDRRAAVGRAALGPPLLDEVLSPGDALYLPRGWLHAAQALGETSAHLTVGVHPVTRFDVVEALTTLVVGNPLLRTSLPLGWSSEDSSPTELDAVRDELIKALQAIEPAELAREMRRRTVHRTLPEPVRPLAQAAAAADVGPKAQVRRRDALVANVSRREDRVLITLSGRTIDLPGEAADAVTVLLSGRPVYVADLPVADPEDGVVIVRRLLREAVVVPVGDRL